MKSLGWGKVSPLKCGDKVQCIAVESDSPMQTKLGIQCVGKLDDGRIVLFDKKSGLSKAIKQGDRIEGSVIVSRSNYVIIVPEKIVEQAHYEKPQALSEKEERQIAGSLKWDHSLIISIRREKEKQKSQDLDRALELISKGLYGEKTHYVLELIQNAEDEDASGISFTILEDKIRVWNNGEVFTPEDVESICSVRGGKRNKIGFFGIGFKSVFNVSDRPQIISSKYNFIIEKFIYPTPCDTATPEDFDPKRGAWVILPYDRDKHKPEGFEQSMKDINEKVLLFLNELKEISFSNVVTGNNWYLERKELEGNIISLFNSSTKTTSLWKVFNKDLKVPKEFRATDELRQKPEVTRIAVAFPVPSDGPVQDVSSETVYCYLPTRRRTDMPFLVQGDFDPTVGRENIKDNEWNKWLLQKIGELAVESYQILRDQGIAHDLLFRYIPACDEVKDPALKNVYEDMKKRLKECAIAPTEDGRWVKPQNAVLDSSEGNLKKLIGNDIQKLKSEEVGYISSAIDQRGLSILLELGAQQVTLDDLISLVKSNELLQDRVKKGPHWFLQLYAYLRQEFYENKIPINRSLYDSQLAQLKSSKMLLTAKNRLVAIHDPEKSDTVIFYPPKVNLEEEYRAFCAGEVDFVNHYFQNDSILRRKPRDSALELQRDNAKEFLAFLGVRRHFDEYTIINDVICRRLELSGELPDESIIRYTTFVRENLDRYVSLARSKHQTSKNEQEILQALGERLTVKAFCLDDEGKNDTFVKVSEVYLSESYGESSMESLFARVPNVVFLSDVYTKNGDAGQWKNFFQKIGGWTCPRIERIESKEINCFDPTYNWIQFQGYYYGRHVLEGDWISPDLQALFAFAESLDKDARAQRFELLWKILNEYWSKIYQGADNCLYIWTPISQPRQAKMKNTSFLNLLRTHPWILASDSSLCEPPKLFTPTATNHMLLGNSVRFLASEGYQSFIKALGIRESPAKHEVMNHLGQLKLYGVSYTKDTLAKFKTMYAFLMEPAEKPEDSDVQELEKIKNTFETEELIYIPRKDKEWWRPSRVFWKDHNQIFGKLRGYLSSFYNPEAFPIFERMGVKETAGLDECIDVLKEISNHGEVTDAVQAIINSVYLECDRLLSTSEYPQETINNLRQLTLLTRPKAGKSEFAHASDVVLADDEHLAGTFSDELKILWLGCSYTEISNFLKTLQIKPLSSLVEVEIKPVDVTDIPAPILEIVREWQQYLDPWVRYKRPKLYGIIAESLEKLGKIQILQAEEIHLTYRLKEDSAEAKSSTSDVYYEKQQNKLYLSASLDPYAPKIASELCRIFIVGETLKEPILALLSAGEDDRKRIEVFEQFGIPREGLPSLVIEKVEPKQVEEVGEETLGEGEKIVPSGMQRETEPEPPETAPVQQIVRVGPILINPDDYVPFEIKELSITSAPQTSTNIEPVVRAAKKLSPASRRRTITITTSPQLPEDVAFELVRKFEESEKRIADDTPRNQKKVGYDLSSTDDTSKRFIDIKSSKHDSIVINIQPSEWRKAELEGDNYYLYVVTGLRSGGTPKLCIIQNPCKHLKPDIPFRISVTNWQHAVRYEVSFAQKEGSQEKTTN